MIEVVERFDLCPWARRAREDGEVRAEILIAPAQDAADVVAAIDRIVNDPKAVLGMVVLAASSITNSELMDLRNAGMRPEVAIAHFHPTGQGDLSSPARLVARLRQSPDPMLQIVRWSALESTHRPPQIPDLATQARWIAGVGSPPPLAVADAIAIANHRSISDIGLAAFDEVVGALARARAVAYGL